MLGSCPRNCLEEGRRTQPSPRDAENGDSLHTFILEGQSEKGEIEDTSEERKVEKQQVSWEADRPIPDEKSCGVSPWKATCYAALVRGSKQGAVHFGHPDHSERQQHALIGSSNSLIKNTQLTRIARLTKAIYMNHRPQGKSSFRLPPGVSLKLDEASVIQSS